MTKKSSSNGLGPPSVLSTTIALDEQQGGADRKRDSTAG
jgi:hypothetical protein